MVMFLNGTFDDHDNSLNNSTHSNGYNQHHHNQLYQQQHNSNATGHIFNPNGGVQLPAHQLLQGASANNNEYTKSGKLRKIKEAKEPKGKKTQGGKNANNKLTAGGMNSSNGNGSTYNDMLPPTSGSKRNNAAMSRSFDDEEEEEEDEEDEEEDDNDEDLPLSQNQYHNANADVLKGNSFLFVCLFLVNFGWVSV